jgi:hypothetical protein
MRKPFDLSHSVCFPFGTFARCRFRLVTTGSVHDDGELGGRFTQIELMARKLGILHPVDLGDYMGTV